MDNGPFISGSRNKADPETGLARHVADLLLAMRPGDVASLHLLPAERSEPPPAMREPLEPF